MPVPDKLDVCVPALSVTVTVAVRAPVAVGVNVTLIVQLEFAATVVPQLFVCAKSPALAPVIDTLIPVSAVPLPLDSVSGCELLVVPEDLIAEAHRCSVSASRSPTPVPDKLDVCVPALSVTVSVPVRAPAAVGVNVTLIVQLEFAATVVPQLSVSAKSPALAPLIATLIPVRLVD